MELNTNMRAHLSGDEGATDFANLLRAIGDGRISFSAEPDTINIPTERGKCVANLEELKAKVYLNLAANSTRPEWLAERAIISPTNRNVNKLNNWLMNELPGEEMEYKSVDSAMSDGEAVQYAVEFLNSLDLTGIPPHILKLKIGSPSWCSSPWSHLRLPTGLDALLPDCTRTSSRQQSLAALTKAKWSSCRRSR